MGMRPVDAYPCRMSIEQNRFDPLDDMWWRMGATLNWWDSTLGHPPAWMPDQSEARERLSHRRPLLLRALALIHEHRTATTGQLNQLDPRLPARPDSRFWLDMLAARLIDYGYPFKPDGRTACTPRTIPWMAVRLPTHTQIEPVLEAMGLNPVQIASLGPGPLRGARQYDRHNLICTDLSVRARQAGWHTLGEAYGRFTLLTGDMMAGNGGPDLILMGEQVRVCVELTASANMALESKFRRWDRILAHDTCAATHVVWVNAARTGSLLTTLDAYCQSRGRQHAADISQWREHWTCTDGWQPQPGNPRPADPQWCRATLTRMAAMFGIPSLEDWNLPAGFDTGLLYD